MGCWNQIQIWLLCNAKDETVWLFGIQLACPLEDNLGLLLLLAAQLNLNFLLLRFLFTLSIRLFIRLLWGALLFILLFHCALCTVCGNLLHFLEVELAPQHLKPFRLSPFLLYLDQAVLQH